MLEAYDHIETHTWQMNRFVLLRLGTQHTNNNTMMMWAENCTFSFHRRYSVASSILRIKSSHTQWTIYSIIPLEHEPEHRNCKELHFRVWVCVFLCVWIHNYVFVCHVVDVVDFDFVDGVDSHPKE